MLFLFGFWFGINTNAVFHTSQRATGWKTSYGAFGTCWNVFLFPSLRTPLCERNYMRNRVCVCVPSIERQTIIFRVRQNQWAARSIAMCQNCQSAITSHNNSKTKNVKETSIESIVAWSSIESNIDSANIGATWTKRHGKMQPRNGSCEMPFFFFEFCAGFLFFFYWFQTHQICLANWGLPFT